MARVLAMAATTPRGMSSTVQNDVPAGTLTVNITGTGTAEHEEAFSIHAGMLAIGTYAGYLAGAVPARIDVRFPTTRHTSLFDGTALHILRLDRWDWDVMHHEYGHYFQSVHDISDNPGGRHTRANMAETRGKDAGTRVAWGEGWPTFFGTAGQATMGMSALGVPNVGNRVYEDTEDTGIVNDLETDPGLGEDNEHSVMAALWDLFDGASDGDDHVTMTDKALFDAIKNASPDRVGDAWNLIAGPLDEERRTQVGCVFAQALISPGLLAPEDGARFVGETPPTFTWQRNGGGPSFRLNAFTVRFFTPSWSPIFEKDVGDVDNWTPTTEEWGSILADSPIVRWVVEGWNTSDPVTPAGLGKYRSCSRTVGGVAIAFVIDDTGSMGNDIEGVKAGLQMFIDFVEALLPEGVTPPAMALVSFKDYVQLRAITTDLSVMRSQVAGLYASGGDDCPEFGAQAIDYASSIVSPGGTILFATDASSQPGVDIGSLIARLRARSIAVHTILSGDCDGDLEAKPSAAGEAGDALAPSSNGPLLPKPGDDGEDEPPVGDIPDPGSQPPIDDHGDDADAATPLTVDGGSIGGFLTYAPDDVDWFRVTLAAGQPYCIDVRSGASTYSCVTYRIYDAAGNDLFGYSLYSCLGYGDAYNLVQYTPGASGDYFVAVSPYYSDGSFSVAVTTGPCVFAGAEDSVSLFSQISDGTGGAFVVRDGVKSGSQADRDAYAAAAFNVMASTLVPAVIFANPQEVPADASLAVTLQGRNTNWRSGSQVAFTGNGITVNSVDVTSATTLVANLTVAAGADLTLRDVTVTTQLGDDVESAFGDSVIGVVAEITTPTILSVEPSTVTRGESRTVVVHGLNTTWTAPATVGMGAGVTVDSVTVVSPTRLDVGIAVDGNAASAFRTVTVSAPSFLSKSRALFVSSGAAAIPLISSVVPAEGTPGNDLEVVLHGSSTSWADGVSVASFGPGVTVDSLDVADPQTATAQVHVSADATAGYRDVSVTTGGETAVILNGFFVTPPTDACTPGDLFPPGGDGQVKLADFVTARRMLNGSVPITQRDIDCGDLHPGVLTCVPASGASNWCVAGNDAFTLGDAVVIRRLLSGAFVLSCAGCAGSVAPSSLVPGDVAPAFAPDGRVDVSDVVRVLRASVGLDALDGDDALRGDVAPARAGIASPDGVVDVSDAVTLLRVAVGLDRVEWPLRAFTLRGNASAPMIAMSVTVTGWPRWAGTSELSSSACEPGAEADARGDGFALTCLTARPVRGAVDLATFTYRAPREVSVSELALRWEGVTDQLVPAGLDVTP